MISLGRENLHRNLDGVDLLLLKERRVRSGHGVDKRGVRPELEGSPSAIAVTDRADFGVLGLELLGASLDFGVALIL